MNKKQKIALLITGVIWLWIAFGGPYDRIIPQSGYGNPYIVYCFRRGIKINNQMYFPDNAGPYFPRIVQAWITLLIPAGIAIYLLKTHK